MYSKNKKLTLYENNFLNVELINFIINSKNLLTNKTKKKLLFEWYKTKWFIKKDLASLSERKNHDCPESIDALSVYITQKEFWPIKTRIPWAYFVALKLGFKPGSEKTWVLLCPANISLNMYQANLKIITEKKIDNKRLSILKKSILAMGGEIIFFLEESNTYLIKLPKEFNKMQSHFPQQVSQLSSYQFSSSDKISKLWRTYMTEIEMEWYQLESNESGANSLWSWGWGSMPSTLENTLKIESQVENRMFENDKTLSLMINGLVYWLEQKTKSNFSFEVSKTFFPKYNLSLLQNYNNEDNKANFTKEILLSVQDFTKALSIFNRNIETNDFDNNNYIFNDEFILIQGKNLVFSKSAKLLLNFKSFLFSLLK